MPTSTIHQIERADSKARVTIHQREDGLFFYTEDRFAEWDDAPSYWINGYPPSGLFETAGEALVEAAATVSWLRASETKLWSAVDDVRPIEMHRSPDGMLTLLVEDIGGDRIIGFAESPWHTHPDLLVPRWGATPAAAERAYVDAVLSGEAVIGIRRKQGAIVEAWITYDAATETDMALEDETLEMRHWDGRSWLPPS